MRAWPTGSELPPRVRLIGPGERPNPNALEAGAPSNMLSALRCGLRNLSGLADMRPSERKRSCGSAMGVCTMPPIPRRLVGRLGEHPGVPLGVIIPLLSELSTRVHEFAERVLFSISSCSNGWSACTHVPSASSSFTEGPRCRALGSFFPFVPCAPMVVLPTGRLAGELISPTLMLTPGPPPSSQPIDASRKVMIRAAESTDHDGASEESASDLCSSNTFR